MSLKSKLRTILPQPSANTANSFRRNENAHQTMLRHNYLLKLDYHIVEHCNLKCKCCSTYAPLAPEKFTDLAVFKADLQRLKDLIGDRLLNLHLLGGEPLLHPDIEQFAEVARAIFPDIFIDIVSNGLLAKSMPDSFWDTLREQNVLFQPSPYPIGLDYGELVEYAKSKGVRAAVWRNEQIINHFTRKGLDPFGQQNMYASYLTCPNANGDTNQLREGRLYRCPTTAYIDYLNNRIRQDDPSAPEETFRLHAMDSLDIYQTNSAEEIFDFLSEAVPFCRYCVCGNITDVPWEKSRQDVREWVDL